MVNLSTLYVFTFQKEQWFGPSGQKTFSPTHTLSSIFSCQTLAFFPPFVTPFKLLLVLQSLGLVLCSPYHPYSFTKYVEMSKYTTCDFKYFVGLKTQKPNGVRELKKNSWSLTLLMSHLSNRTKAVHFGKAFDEQHSFKSHPLTLYVT